MFEFTDKDVLLMNEKLRVLEVWQKLGSLYGVGVDRLRNLLDVATNKKVF